MEIAYDEPLNAEGPTEFSSGNEAKGRISIRYCWVLITPPSMKNFVNGLSIERMETCQTMRKSQL